MLSMLQALQAQVLFKYQIASNVAGFVVKGYYILQTRIKNKTRPISITFHSYTPLHLTSNLCLVSVQKIKTDGKVVERPTCISSLPNPDRTIVVVPKADSFTR